MSEPRVLLITPGAGDSSVWRCFQAELQEVICRVEDVDVVTPCEIKRGTGRLTRIVQQRIRRAAGITLGFDQRLQAVQLEHGYELCCVLVQNVHDLAILEAVPDWRRRSRQAICWIDELWLTEMNDQRLARLSKFDRVAVGFFNTVERLQDRIDVQCEWLPPGVDMIRFHPGDNPPPRTIDFFSMGRRSEATHQALLDYSARRGWFYFYDTVHGGKATQLAEHRGQLADLIKRTRYFLVNRAKVGELTQTGGQEELGHRYFEGAAAGAMLVGDWPRCPGFAKCFDWDDAVVRIPFGSTDVESVLDELESEPERVESIRRENVVQSLRRFDWGYRWAAILGWMGLEPTVALQERMARLADLASEILRV